MSHYVALVLLPASTKPEDYEAEIAKRLTRYDEGRPVPAYQQACYCVGHAAQRAVDAQVDATLGTIEKLRTDFHAASPDVEDPDVEQKRWKAAIAPRIEMKQALLAVHPDSDKPADDCSECGGTGRIMTTYNPESKWDWWVIGGRWSGYLDPVSRKKNAVSAAALAARPDDDWVPFAIVTPDGEWNEKGRMRWFAIVDDETDEGEWVKQARAILAANLETVAVAVDLHI